jgi:surfactin synthase thioesterase subunit
MKMPEEVVRVEITYASGKKKWIEGEEAKKWQDAAEGQAVFCHVHGNHFPELAWNEEPAKKNEP